jgi:hypothetical protein
MKSSSKLCTKKPPADILGEWLNFNLKSYRLNCRGDFGVSTGIVLAPSRKDGKS